MHWAIIVSAGSGKRMRHTTPKQYLNLGNATVLEHTVQRFIDYPLFQKVILVLAANDKYWQKSALAKHANLIVVTGGASRDESTLNGLQHLAQYAKASDWVWVHDGVRPLISVEDLVRLNDSLVDNAVGSILAKPVSNTLKHVKQGRVMQTLDRQAYWQALTPQVFPYQMLTKVLTKTLKAKQHVTDEAMAIELSGLHPKIVSGRHDNIKITYPDDLELAQWLLQNNRSKAQCV